MKLDWREPGLPASVVLHGVLLVAALVSFASPKPFADAQEAIAVEVIDENAAREMMRGEQAARPQPTPAPRVDRVAEQKEQNAPGVAQRQVNTDQQPTRQEATAPRSAASRPPLCRRRPHRASYHPARASPPGRAAARSHTAEACARGEDRAGRGGRGGGAPGAAPEGRGAAQGRGDPPR